MGTCLARNVRTVAFHRVLIVEPDTILRLQMRNAVGNLAGVDAESGVPTARQRLLTTALNWLVTNIRLDAYNGLHLAYLAKMAQEPPNILVYGERVRPDPRTRSAATRRLLRVEGNQSSRAWRHISRAFCRRATAAMSPSTIGAWRSGADVGAVMRPVQRFNADGARRRAVHASGPAVSPIGEPSGYPAG